MAFIYENAELFLGFCVLKVTYGCLKSKRAVTYDAETSYPPHEGYEHKHLTYLGSK